MRSDVSNRGVVPAPRLIAVTHLSNLQKLHPLRQDAIMKPAITIMRM